MLHIGPVPAYVFALLFSIPVYAWCSLVFVVFNLLTAWGIRLISGATLPALVFLFVSPLFGGSAMYVEVMVTTFGVWGFYFARKKSWWAVPFLVLAAATKLTGLAFPFAVLCDIVL